MINMMIKSDYSKVLMKQKDVKLLPLSLFSIDLLSMISMQQYIGMVWITYFNGFIGTASYETCPSHIEC